MIDQIICLSIRFSRSPFQLNACVSAHRLLSKRSAKEIFVVIPFAVFFGSEPVAFRQVYGLESYSRTSGESNHQRQSVSDTRVPRYQLHHEDDCCVRSRPAVKNIGSSAVRFTSKSKTCKATTDANISAEVLAQDELFSGPLKNQGAPSAPISKDNQGALFFVRARCLSADLRLESYSRTSGE